MRDSVSGSARNLIRLDNLDGAGHLVMTQLEKCKDQGSTSEIWSLRLIHADLMRLRGQPEQALEYLAAKEAAFTPSAGDLITYASLRRQRGYYLGLLGRYELSHGLLGEAERIARDAELLELQCEVYQCQAMIYYLQQNYVLSDRIFRLILDASEKLGGWYFRANGLWGIGKNLMIQGHHATAIPWLEESLGLFESAEAKLSIAIVWSELAVCYLGLGDDKKSLELLQNALRVTHEARTVQNHQVVLANIGNVYLHRGDYLRAIEYYRRALALAQEIKDPVSIEKWSYNIRLAYARLRQAVDQLDSKTA
jgi:tetratricopeptide (TPR) repeat protein